MENKPKSLILIGGGNRGNNYVKLGVKSGKFKLVAIAEPIKARRDYIAERYGVAADMCFDSWEPLIALGKIADAAIISTMDRDHFAPAKAAMQCGYDLLLEKPVSPVLEECTELERVARDCGVKVLVCHVLRYSKFFLALKSLISAGKVGKIMNIEHSEGVGNVHQSHSFVRGNWSNEQRSSFMLLQKSCHDLDILQWLVDAKCLRVQSFGKLSYFTPDNAPEGATARCFDGCPHIDTCTYSAKKLYVERKNDGNWFRGAATKLHEECSDDVVMEALEKTDYGRCVFMCDNDVVDHQTVNMEFENDIIISFTMSAFNLGGRRIKIMGTKGEIIGSTNEPEFIFSDLLTGKTESIRIDDAISADNITGGHGGGDEGILNSFYEMLCGKSDSEMSNISVSVENHKIVFAAERSRREGRVVSLSELDQ